MTNSARILALVAIAAFGLLALKSLSLSQNVLRVFDPASPAWAAPPSPKEKQKKDSQEKTDEHNEGTASSRVPALATNADDEEASRAPPPKCEGPTPAEQAGLSQQELNVYLTLGQRNRVLDKRESEIATREGLVEVSQQQLDERIQQMEALKTDISGLLGQLDEEEEAQARTLTKLYDTMKPKSAAQIFIDLDKDVLLQVTSRMKADNLAKVMAAMPAKQAADLTIALAARHRLPEQAKDLPGFSGGQK